MRIKISWEQPGRTNHVISLVGKVQQMFSSCHLVNLDISGHRLKFCSCQPLSFYSDQDFMEKAGKNKQCHFSGWSRSTNVQLVSLGES